MISCDPNSNIFSRNWLICLHVAAVSKCLFCESFLPQLTNMRDVVLLFGLVKAKVIRTREIDDHEIDLDILGGEEKDIFPIPSGARGYI